MANLLDIIIGVKKHADEARGKKKGMNLGFLGSQGGSSKAYKEAQDALEEEDEGAEKK